MILALSVGLAAAVGAPLRYVVDRLVQSRSRGAFPWGTFLVNVSGSFLLGLLTGLTLHHGLDPDVRTIIGSGMLGAYTTFSTFGYETIRLLEDGSFLQATLNAAGSLTLGLLAAAAGLGLTLLH